MVLRKAGEEAEDAASEGLLTAAAIVRIKPSPLRASFRLPATDSA